MGIVDNSEGEEICTNRKGTSEKDNEGMQDRGHV